jgi:hypothetical protein
MGTPLKLILDFDPVVSVSVREFPIHCETTVDVQLDVDGIDFLTLVGNEHDEVPAENRSAPTSPPVRPLPTDCIRGAATCSEATTILATIFDYIKWDYYIFKG